MEFLDSGGAIAGDDGAALGQKPSDDGTALGQEESEPEDVDEADMETKSLASSVGTMKALPLVMRGKIPQCFCAGVKRTSRRL